MKKIVFRLTALALAGCGNDAKALPLSTGPIDLVGNPSSWSFIPISPHPTIRKREDGSLAFDIPSHAQKQIVGYVLQSVNQNISNKKTIKLTFEIEGVADYVANDPKETCPCYVTVMLQVRADNLMDEYGRFFYRNRLELKPGLQTVEIPISQDQWGSVGSGINAGDPVAGFRNVLTNLGNFGLTFGGKYFAGHGVSVQNGMATFILREATIQ